MKCEGAALTCLNEIREQIETKRVLIFALRSLVEYLSTRGRGVGQFVDNVLGCIEADLTLVLIDLNKRYGETDEDILLHLVKIVGSMTKAFAIAAEQNNAASSALVQKSLDQGYETLLRELLYSACTRVPLSDAQFWLAIHDPLLKSLNPTSTGSQAAHILKITPESISALDTRLQKEKKINKNALSAATILAHVCPNPPSSIPMTLLGCLQQNLFVNQTSPLDHAFTAEVLSSILHILGKAGPLSGAGGGQELAAAKTEAIDATLKIMDYTKDKKSLQETLGRILGLLIGPDELHACTEDLVSGGSLRSLKILSALSKASSTSDLKKQMVEPVLKILSNFSDPADDSQLESLCSALSILQSITEASSCSQEKLKTFADQLVRILLIPNFPTGEEVTLTILTSLCQSNDSLKPENLPDEFYHLISQIISSEGNCSVKIAEKAIFLTAQLCAKSDQACQKTLSANIQDVALKRFEDALATEKASKPNSKTDLARPAALLVGSIGKLQESLMKTNLEKTLASLKPITQSLRLMTSDDRYAFEAVLPYLQKVSSTSNPLVDEQLAEADVATGVLKCSITFADYLHIVKACEAILKTAVSSADMDKAVQNLVKLSKEPKTNLPACEDACATIHGVASISSNQTTIDASTLDGLIKSLTHVTSVPFHAGQCRLISQILACIRIVAPAVSTRQPFKDEPHKLLSIAHSAGVRAIADQEVQSHSGGRTVDSVVTEIVKCANSIILLDHFSNEASFEKCISDVSTLMRKYPEQRKTQLASLTLLSSLVASSAFDVSQEFLKSGLCKQLFNTMIKGIAIQEYQSIGLKIILSVAQRKTENLDGLRRVGVIDVLKLISEQYQAKPDVLRLCQQAQALLMPQDQVRDEVLSQIETLEAAGKHRDVRSGADALTALAGLTAAADAAKFASKNGMGNAMNAFFDAMHSGPPQSGNLLDTCSLGAVQTIRNVGLVGRPHSTLMLKSGALPLVQTILMEAVQNAENSPEQSDLTSQVIAQCLEAARSLLSAESNPHNVMGAKEFSACLHTLLPTLLKSNDPKQIMNIVSAMGVMVTNEDLAADAPLVKSLPSLIEVLKTATKEEERVEVLRCIYQMTGRSAKLVERFAEAGGCEAVIQCLDSYGADEQKTAVWCRKVLERLVGTIGDSASLRNAMMKTGGASSVEHAVKALGRNLGTGSDQAANSTAMISMLCHLTAHSTGGTHLSDNTRALITEAIEASGSNPQLKGMIGELLTNLGGDKMINEYFTKIITICDDAKARSSANSLSISELRSNELSDTLKKLDNFIFCHPDDINETFSAAPRAMTCLSDWLTHLDIDLAVQTSELMMNMSRRFQSDSLSPYGVQACIQSGYVNRSISSLCQPSSDFRKSPQFLTNFYETLVLSCSNASTYNSIYKIVSDSNFLSTTWLLLDRYKNQEDVATPIINFLGQFSRSGEAADLLEKTCKQTSIGSSGGRNIGAGDDACSTIWNVVWHLRRNGQCVGSGLDAIGMIGNYNRKAKLFENKLVLRDQIRELALQSPEACCGYAGMARCFMETERTSPQDPENLELLYDDLLEILVKQYYKIKDDDSVIREVRDRLLRRMAGVADSLSRKGDYHLIRKSKLVSCLGEAAKSEMDCRQALQSFLKVISILKDDQQSWNNLVTISIPIVATQLSEEILENQDNCRSLVLSCLHLTQDNDCKRAFQEIPELLKLMIDIEALAKSVQDEELRINAEKLRLMLETKLDEKLTLEIVYKRWKCRIQRQQQQGGTAQPNDSSSAADPPGYEILNVGSTATFELLNELEFVLRETQELSTQPQKSVATSPVAREFWFGCHCIRLLHMVSINAKILASGLRGAGDGAPGAKIQEWTLKALEFQPAEESLQAICQGLVRGVANASSEYASVSKAALTIVELVRRGTMHTACQEGIHSWSIAKVIDHIEPSETGGASGARSPSTSLTAENWLVERLCLMASICANDRCFYNSTDALDVLKYIISLVETQSAYGIETVRAVLKVLRAMANEHICDKFIELKFPEYLLGLIDSLDSPDDLLADDLMVVGFMASFLKTKNYFGRLEGVQKIVHLLKRKEKLKHTTQSAQIALSRVQQNACLAVGNLILGHPQNGTNFGKEGGVVLAIQILNNSMTGKVDYDLANAVCVLISNASFKRDDFKEAFGNNDACIAILQCIKSYDGADCPSAYRCLNSMFKAIGNLALIPNNVQRFLDADIGQCLKVFYNQDSSTASGKGRAPIPDDLLLVSLKTLSNLTLENADAFMIHFGAIIKPLIALISSGQHNSAELMSFVCDTFASLCRNSENRETFIKNKGIEKTIELVNQFKDECVYLKGLDLFGVLASYPHAAEIMADSGIFSFILGVLEECGELDALTIVSALRVIRRLVKDTKVAERFIDASPMPLLCECLRAATPYVDHSVPCSLTTKEICHIVLILLATHAVDPTNDSVDYNELAIPREVAWAEDVLTGSSTLTAKQFSRIFSKRAKSNPESDESSESDPTPALASDDKSQMSTSAVDNHSAASNPSTDHDQTYPEEEMGSPVDLQTPPRKGESTLDIHSNVTSQENLNKPKAPRAWQIIGLDPRTFVSMCRAIFLMLATGANDAMEDGTLRQDKLSEMSLLLLAYLICEKVDGCGLVCHNSGTAAAITHQPDCSDISILVVKIFSKTREQRGPAKFTQLMIGAEFLANVCCVLDTSDLASIPANPLAIEALKSSAAALTKSAEAPVRRKIEDIWALFQQSADDPESIKAAQFFELVSYTYPLNTGSLFVEEFANGVQDLPTKVRGKIRRGGKNKCIVKDESGNYTVQPLWWKSSTDMMAIKFMTDKETQNYDSQIIIGRARRIVRGTTDPDLKKQLTALKVKSRNIVSINGGDSPGVHMLFSNRLKASRMYDRITLWHAAATR